MASPIVLIDLSSIAYPTWHTTQDNPDPNFASAEMVRRVRRLAGQSRHVAVCVDAGASFRAELYPAYKGNRPERDARLSHQIRLAIDQLRGDGFPIWSAKGFEADDVIASATRRALNETDAEIEVVTADKDLLQLVGDRVHVRSVRDDSRIDADGVLAKFGVTPSQIRDYLCLVGDTSDNVPGVDGIGAKTAAALLSRHGSIDEVYRELDAVGPVVLRISTRVAKGLAAFRGEPLNISRRLISLREDADIPFADVLSPRERSTAPEHRHHYDHASYDEGDRMTDTTAETASTPAAETPTTTIADPPAPVLEGTVVEPEKADKPSDAKPKTDDPTRALMFERTISRDYERQLDPLTLSQAQKLSVDLHRSGMFQGYGSPEAVLSTIMVGRELGIPAMTSLRTIHNIEGRHSLSAQLIVGLVLKSGKAEYFELAELTDTTCTFITKRVGGKSEQRITHTIEMARVAGLLKGDSNWVKVPQDMLVARASVRLARLVYPDICANVYTPEELRELREAA